MKPLTISGGSANDDETMSFLPPPKEVRVPKSVRVKRSDQQIRANRMHDSSDKYVNHKRFCLPWMIETIAFMVFIACAFLLKGLYTHFEGGFEEHFEGKEVATWENLSLDNIQHWCLNEKAVDCSCASPLNPAARHGHKTWTQAHLQNIEDAAHHRNDSWDVVFLGDSIMEGWKGLSFGRAVEHKKGNVEVFEKMFDSNKGGDVDGLVLGIAGDKSPNLLWRIQNGELPKLLEAKVFWILVGTNDFLKDGLEHCSAEVVTMGIKRVAKEVQILKPNATIIINEILPRAPGTPNGELYGNDETKSVTNAIKKVNREIEKFCNQHDNLDYFNAGDIFIKRKGAGRDGEYIPNDLMRDYLHPTTKGYAQWGEEILKKLSSIMKSDI